MGGRSRQDRNRATSECEDALLNTRARLGARQRTCSEGSGGDLRTELVRQRFLNNAARSSPGSPVSSSGSPQALVTCLNPELVAKKSHPVSGSPSSELQPSS